MKLLNHLDQIDEAIRGGSVSIGNFDGLHLGHARLVRTLVGHAHRIGGAAIVLTFEPHPARVLRPEAAPAPLFWLERKAAMLAELGVDYMIAWPTDRELLSLSPEEFFNKIVQDTLDARVMIEGPNFNFGRKRAGNVDLLQQLCDASGRELEIVNPLIVGGEYVSSSRVRRLISEGDVGSARNFLTCPYRLRGTVIRGAGRGATIGYATANLDNVDTLIPAAGIYACVAHAGDIHRPAAASIGPNPTFGENEFKVEIHLLDFDGDLYGQTLEVDFLECLRGVQTFDGVDALLAQMKKDIAQARTIAEHEM